MICKAVDIIGHKYGRLLVISRANDYILKNDKKKTRWLCRCDCGKEIEVMKNSLISGLTKSCRCLRKEKSNERLKKENRFDISGNFGIG